MKRFEPDGTTFETACDYFHNRAVQGLSDRYCWSHEVTPLVEDGVEWGAATTCTDAKGTLYRSFYVYLAHRRGGRVTRFLSSSEVPVVTAPDCDIEAFLASRKVPFVVAAQLTRCQEYQAVQRLYGDGRAARSGVWFMNHIDEGLAVLCDLGASESAKKAYCLHPLFQADADLAIWAGRSAEVTTDPYVLLLALEYRNIANAYLSRREISGVSEIALGPLRDVHDMLRADKVQNYKDFLLHHAATHERATALDRYFRFWLERLEISRESFASWYERLQCSQKPQALTAW